MKVPAAWVTGVWESLFVSVLFGNLMVSLDHPSYHNLFVLCCVLCACVCVHVCVCARCTCVYTTGLFLVIIKSSP